MKKMMRWFRVNKRFRHRMVLVLILFLASLAVLANICFNKHSQCFAKESGEPCYLCSSGGLMGYYASGNSIGVINLNTGLISGLELETGSRKRQGSEIHYTTDPGKGSSVCISDGGNRRIGNITILAGEEDDFDEVRARNILCPHCIKKVYDTYKDRINVSIPDAALVDFAERKLYPVDPGHRAYFIRDYYLHFDFSEEEVGILVFYAPDMAEETKEAETAVE